MSIRNRVISFDGLALTTSQTGVVLAAFRMPAIGRVIGVRATAVGTGASNAVGVYQNPGVADDTAANSTTLVHDAALAVVTADTPVSDPMTGQYPIAKGVWLYLKGTTVGTAFASLTVQVELNY